MHLWLEVVGEAGAAAPAQDASAADQPAGPVADVLREGAVSGEAILAAVRTAEAELHDLYDAHVSRGYTEPVRVALARHRREEAAHLSFINEGELWRRPGTDTAAEMLPEAAADEPLASAG
jgi:hypothetical protein